MANSQVLDMPVKFCLEFVAVVRPHCVNTEGESGDEMIDEMNGIFLRVFGIDL